MAGQSSVMFGGSLNEVSVLGSQVFGQASMDGCAVQPSGVSTCTAVIQPAEKVCFSLDLAVSFY